MSLLAFKVTDYEASSLEFSHLPNGEYVAEIKSAEIKLTNNAIKNNTNDCFLNIRFVVTSGEFSGRSVWEKLNIVNANEQAQSIARSRLRGIAKILNIEEELDKTRDINYLIGLKIGIVVTTEEYQGSIKNKIKLYKNFDSVRLASINGARVAPNLSSIDNVMSNKDGDNQNREFEDDIPF
jgi:hypothetical protein